MAKKVDVKNEKFLKKVGKELQLIVNPSTEDKKPIIITKGTMKQIKKKIIESSALLTTADEISDELAATLAKFKVEIAEPAGDDDNDNDNDDNDNNDVIDKDIDNHDDNDNDNNDDDNDNDNDDNDNDDNNDNDDDAVDLSEMDADELIAHAKEQGLKLTKKERKLKKKKLLPLVESMLVELAKDQDNDNDNDNDDDDNDDDDNDDNDNDDNDDNDNDDDDDDELSLEEQINAAKKLGELKTIVEGNDEFKKLRKKLKDFKGLQAVRQLKPLMFKAIGIKVEKPAAKEKKAKTPGVIATIVTLISSKPMSKATLLKKLVKAFPDRDAEKMEKTLNIQVPNRIRKEKNESLEENKKGKWFFKKTQGDVKKTS
jgi:hypothetical protein